MIKKSTKIILKIIYTLFLFLFISSGIYVLFQKNIDIIDILLSILLILICLFNLLVIYHKKPIEPEFDWISYVKEHGKPVDFSKYNYTPQSTIRANDLILGNLSVYTGASYERINENHYDLYYRGRKFGEVSNGTMYVNKSSHAYRLLGNTLDDAKDMLVVDEYEDEDFLFDLVRGYR